jgi:glycosyltransferase involved in cell wall biosynthesis
LGAIEYFEWISKMTSVLHVNAVRWNSAIAEYAISSIKCLSLLGLSNTLICLQDTPLARRAKEIPGCKVIEFDSFSLRRFFDAQTAVKNLKPEFIIAYGGPETILFGPHKVSAKMIRVRGYALDPAKSKIPFAHDAGLIGVDFVVTPSAQLAKKVQMVSQKKVIPITIGIDATKHFFDQESFEQREFLDLCIFGRFDPVKGHGDFIKTFAVIKKVWRRFSASDRSLRLVIAGKSENVSTVHLENWAQESGLEKEDMVVIDGKVEDKSKFMSQVTLGVVSSLGSEEICRVAEEFLLCGVPLVVSGVGALKEMVQEQKFGLSYDGLSMDDRALAIAKLAAQVDLETADDRRQRHFLAKTHFGLESMAECWKKILNVT